MIKPRATTDLPIVDPFSQKTWAPGAIQKTIETALSVPVADRQYGKLESVYDADTFERYLNTLGGKPIESFDPNGFLTKTLGLRNLRSPGRCNEDLLQGLKLAKDYKPEPTYLLSLPLPRWVIAAAQNFLLTLNKVATPLASLPIRLLDRLVTDRFDEVDQNDKYPFGRETDIMLDGYTQAPITPKQRYAEALRRQRPQLAWGESIHEGGLTSSPTPLEHAATERIAVKLGFSAKQADNIGRACIAVDNNETHYRDPTDPEHREHRITASGSGGANGDFQLHYNRSPEGCQDSRITAARIHMDRAVALAGIHHYDAAEAELGIGLHSLQDIFSHAQLSPLGHSILDGFPDLVKRHPIEVYETAQATEAYLRLYLKRLGISEKTRVTETDARLQQTCGRIVGDATPAQKRAVVEALFRYPKELVGFLQKNGITIHVAAEGTKMTDLGFAAETRDGRIWNDLPGGYDHDRRLVVIRAEVTVDADKLDQVLREETGHAFDMTMRDHPQLGVRWNAYVNRLYNAARRAGKIDFDELDPAEYFAGSRGQTPNSP